MSTLTAQATNNSDFKKLLSTMKGHPRIQVRSATVRHLSSHTHFFEYDGWLPKA